MSDVNFEQLSEALDLAGAMGDPGELHGQLCGLACVMGMEAGQAWVMQALADADAPASTVKLAEEPLIAIAGRSLAALDDGDMSLQLALPHDDAELALRAEALAHWCQGFLHGLGSSASDDSILTEGSTGEIVKDFSEITRAGFESDDNEEEAEAAYAELVEFVRVSAQLVFEELQPFRDKPRPVKTH